MKCKLCGAEIDDRSKFCTECGNEVTRERTLIDPFPELDEYRRERNRLQVVDEHSKLLNIYCYVMIALFAVIFIVGFVLKIEFLPIFTGIFIGILLLMLWANNRQAKRVRFAVPRILVIFLPLFMIQIIAASVFMYHSSTSFDAPIFESEVSDEGSDLAYMVGKYTRSYEEELEGENIEITETVVLNDDHTCEVTFQDTISGEWSETNMRLDDGEEFEITVEGDYLYLYMNDEWVEFSR